MQAIICCTDEGLVMASDSLSVDEHDGAQATMQKVYPLGMHAAILTSGAAIGVQLSRDLSQWLQARQLEDFDDTVAVSRDFLAQGYAHHLRARHGRSGQHAPAERHLYFAIGGYSGQQASSPYLAILLHSEAGDLPFQEMRLPRVFTLPRKVVFEGRVTRQIAEGIGLRPLATVCLEALAGMAERKPEAVGGPFDVAIVRSSGTELVETPPGLADTEADS